MQIIQKPILKNVILTTVCGTVSGVLCEFMSETFGESKWLEKIDWYIVPVLFGVFIWIAFKNTSNASLFNKILFVASMIAIYIGSIYLVAFDIGLFVFGVPGLLVALSTGLLLKVKITILNLAIAAVFSYVAIMFTIDPLSWFDFHIKYLFIFWQGLVGLALGLMNRKTLST